MKKGLSVMFVLMIMIAQVGFGQVVYRPIKRILSNSVVVVPYTGTCTLPVAKKVVAPVQKVVAPVSVAPTLIK